MSAYIEDKAHIDALVALAVRGPSGLAVSPDTVWHRLRWAARDAAWGAAGLVSRDLIGQYGFTQAHYDILTMPWRRAIGPIHPDDKPLGGGVLMATISDKARFLDEPIPHVSAERVQLAGARVVDEFGPDAGDVLSMLGITAESLRFGLGYADGVAS